jgi:anti-sigma B factor antagonist
LPVGGSLEVTQAGMGQRLPILTGFSPGRTLPSMAEPIPPVSVTSQKDIRIVEFTNNKILDEGNISNIGTTLATLIDEAAQPKLLLDFANVEHLSSAALGMLISVNNKIRQKDGQLRLANIKPQIFEVFVITKLNKLFRILPTRSDALNSFAQ